MPFFPVLLVDVQRTFRLLPDERYGGNLYPITTAERAAGQFLCTCLANASCTVRRRARQTESVRWKESGPATSRQDACGSPLIVRVALPDARVATHPVADRAVRLAPALLVPRSWPAI